MDDAARHALVGRIREREAIEEALGARAAADGATVFAAASARSQS